ncbi:hypothetical protein GALMADRAFT_144781 [Galerina marginata CBS 339.88]|uniref:F-box domain-containing protein n=1 Tax=Galerina marginata (strain CBS 339.88) TaxID=685588 RepID=A0A067SHV5_GALM3|nr:hypothetical protein GALMADRAFT_144781 [Galerina marginata CBS 339.88]
MTMGVFAELCSSLPYGATVYIRYAIVDKAVVSTLPLVELHLYMMSIPTSPQQTENERSKRTPFLILHRDEEPPISRLSHDILWHIFHHSTIIDADFLASEISPERSLITARHASQVCAGWRSLMLSSPSLWANIINLTHLDQENDNWRAEILKRTGNSLLSIIGNAGEGRPAAEFFLSLLGDHWLRFRRIYIRIGFPADIEDKRWRSIQRPAPNLEILHINFPSPPQAFSTIDDTLFSNDAPSLHTLTTYAINFKISGSWLSGLRRLQIFDCSVGQAIIFALAEMSVLEFLDMTDVDIVDIHAEDRSWPMITLPKLKKLCLKVKFRTLIVMIGHLNPTLGCESRYESSDVTISPLTTEDLFLLRRGWTAHFQCLSNYSPIDTISWAMIEDFIELGNAVKWSCDATFFFHVEVGQGERHGIHDIILHCLLNSCDFSAVTTVELDISPGGLELSKLRFAALCRSLSSVVTMHTESHTMEVLLQLCVELNGEILFPSLETIIFDTDVELKCDAIMRFLLHRLNAGIPITDFDLSDCTSPNQDRLLFLEGINGLDVVWNEEIRNRME